LLLSVCGSAVGWIVEDTEAGTCEKTTP
jgi:hypothetical protein